MLVELEEVVDLARDAVRTLAEVPSAKGALPIHGVVLGTDDRSAPTLALTGGVHGLERIGTHVVLGFLRGLLGALSWNARLRRRFEGLRVVSVPLVNPGGWEACTRSNPSGVDLMRNAPVEAEGPSNVGLAGGHRISPRLPWYRGATGVLEPEARALCEFVEAEVFPSARALLIDCHSGFGFRDRLWHPYAKTQAPFPRVREARALAALLDAARPHHGYVIEPQSASYTTHGDLLDHLFDRHAEERPGAVFIPWTLEMGSWRWVRRRPWQALSRLGWFNPGDQTARARVVHHHSALFDTLLDALESPGAWLQGT